MSTKTKPNDTPLHGRLASRLERRANNANLLGSTPTLAGFILPYDYVHTKSLHPKNTNSTLNQHDDFNLIVILIICLIYLLTLIFTRYTFDHILALSKRSSAL